MKLVYVQSKDRRPLMPCTPAIARILLKKGKAKVLRREPFTIKLLYDLEEEHVQPCTIGVDTGSGTLGTATVTDDGKVLYMSEVEVRNDIKRTMTERSKYRHNRRNRKTRYRKPRFDNRKNSIKSDRFSPTMTSKLNTHEKEIRFIRRLLPCKGEVIFETATFDPHLLKNPALANEKVRHWGYQKGPNYGFSNTRATVLARDKYTCQCCKGKCKNSHLEVHHIVYRSNGGSDEYENLITLCHSCHKDVHAGRKDFKVTGRKRGNLAFATQMNVIRSQLLKRHEEEGCIETYGYVTKANREALGLPKSHCIDAAVIASGGNRLTFYTTECLKKKCVSDGDFQKTKGVRSERRLETGKIHGFRKFDKVLYMGEEYFIKGRMSSGYAVLMNIEGETVDFKHMPKGWKTPKLSNMKRLTARNEWMIMTVADILSTA